MNRFLMSALALAAAQFAALAAQAAAPQAEAAPAAAPTSTAAAAPDAKLAAQPESQSVRVKRLKDGMERKISRGPKGERMAVTPRWQEMWAQHKDVADDPNSEIKDMARFDEPQGAQVHFLQKRLPAGMTAVGPSNYEAALKHAQTMPQRGGDVRRKALKAGVASAALASNWTARGPGNIGGRTRALLIHPTSPNIMWAAGAAGGIWKSTDGGASWTPKADLLVNIAVNSMLLDPRNPNVLYAGTGEGFFNADAVRGAGVLKSTDGGETWTQIASTANNSDFFYVQKLVISKGSSQRLYAATRTGVFRSNDGGGTWTKVLNGAGVNGCMDLAIQTDRALANVFAACGTFAQSTIYRALDTAGTQNWVPVHSPAGAGRTTLALAPSNQNIIYAMAASNVAGNYRDGLLGVYRSTASGAAGSWTTQVDNTSPTRLNRALLSNTVYHFLADCGFGGSNQFLNQGWYDNTLAVDPKDPNIVWAGGIDLFRSNDGGQNWGQASHWWFTAGVDPEYNHADQHTIVFHPQYDGVTNRIMYTGNDGGVHRTMDARAPVSFSPEPVNGASPVCGNTAPGVLSWQSLNNGYEVTQFYHGVAYPDGNTFFGGTQDNGTLRGSIGSTTWSMIRGGDGGYVAVNPANTNMLWAENTNLSIQRSTNGGATYSSVTSGITEPQGNFLFITPFVQDPTNASRMYIGGARVWRASNATAVPAPNPYWTLVSQFLGTRVSALAVSPVNPDQVMVGTQTGLVFRTNVATTANNTTVWASSQPRGGSNYVSWVTADPVNSNIWYATVSTFNSGANVGHVFKSTDAGATWASIDGVGATAVPDVPVHSLVVDPLDTQRIYIGTDIGVFSTTDGGLNWARENSGFANVIVESLEIKGRRLYAFTHGRSMFTVDLP